MQTRRKPPRGKSPLRYSKTFGPLADQRKKINSANHLLGSAGFHRPSRGIPLIPELKLPSQLEQTE